MEAGHELRSSSRQSSSSQSQGSAAPVAVAVAVAGTSRKEDPESGAKSGAPDVSSERAPRAFLNSSFGQRLSAQCGAIFLDAHNSSQRPESGFSRPQANGIADEESRANNTSSRLPEAHALVASEPRPVRLWAFPPRFPPAAALPRPRPLALSVPGTQVVRRDTSPLQLVHRLPSEEASRAEQNGCLRVLEIVEGKKQNGTLSSDLEEGRKDMASARTSTSLSLEQGAKLQSQQHHAEDAALLTGDTSLPGPSLSVAADSEGPSEAGAGSGNPKRPSFKSDCGFLKLLPSKRKFSSEDHEAQQPKANASYVLSGDRHMACPSVERLSSNGSAGNVINRRSLLLQLKSTSANDLGGMKEFHQGKVHHNRDWSTGKERRTAACPDANGAKPAVGSFMKWMIDVGKGLAKKRCFGTMQPPPADMSPTSSPITGICADPSRSKASSNLHLASRLCDSSKPSEDGRTGLSPQSCQNMDTEGPASQSRRQQQLLDSSPKQVATEEGKNSSVPEEACDMHISGDEQQQERPVKAEASPAAEAFGHAAELHSSQNATQGTTSRSQVAGSHLKDASVSNKLEQQQQQQQEPEEVVSAIKSNRTGGEEASLNVWTSSSALAEQTKVTPNRGTVEVRTPGSGTVLRSPRHPAAGEMVNECSQGMAEFVTSMACVKNWVVQNRVKTSPIKSRNNQRRCNFCGLDGHTVVDCSETLDCELKDLERRSCVLDEMGTEPRDLPCLRCLGMGHLGAQCKFSVTEAASRARENSELRSWNFARKSASATSQHPQQQQQQQGSDVLKQQEKTVAVGNGLKQRTSPSEKNNNTNALKTKKQDGTSPVAGNTNLYKRLSFPASKDTKAATKRKPAATDSSPPAPPKNMLVLVEAVRLSRSELWRWVDFPDVSTQVRGFFLRLRFGRWEKDLGGTGYRMARIRGALRKNGTEEKNMSVSVDLGDLECTVDSQYVSNHPFTEAELLEWWRGRWKAGKRIISEAELQVKLAQRKCLLQ